MKKNGYDYFENRECEYFPCHKTTGDSFNCLFCYCPLYALGEKCGGNFTYMNGVKCCTDCMLPHGEGGYRYILSKAEELKKVAAKKENND